MIIPALLILTIANPVAPAAHTVTEYLRALQNLDYQRMAQYWAADSVSVSSSGHELPIDRDRMRSMRDFERSEHTTWSFAIQSAEGPNVRALLTERNDLYDALGVGTCTEVVLYRVAHQKILRMETLRISYSRRPFPEALHEFEQWLAQVGASQDHLLMRDGHLLFSESAAVHLTPWLTSWAREHTKTPAPSGHEASPNPSLQRTNPG